MKRDKRSAILFLMFLGFFLNAQSQRINYSEILKDDLKQINFEIIGRVGPNIHIYKNSKLRNDIDIYDNDMKLVSTQTINFLPEKLGNVEFVAYPDGYWMFYQYQKRNIVYLSAAKFNAEGKIVKEPFDIDTSHIPGSNNKIYSVINSDDKQHILIFKISNKDERLLNFTILRFNAECKLQEKNIVPYKVSDPDGIFTDFIVNNNGDFLFARCNRVGAREFIEKMDITIKKPQTDTFSTSNVPLNEFTLDEVKIKADNLNKRFILSSFYYKQRKVNIEGIFNIIFEAQTNEIGKISAISFGDTLRMEAKSVNSNNKQAFNDYFIKNIIPKKDGGFVLLTELYYTSARNTNTWNRWDYMYPYTYFSPYNYWYYSPYSSMNYYRWWDPFSRYGYNPNRHYTENIVVMSFDKDVNVEWNNVVRKSQYDDNSDIMLSYQLFYTGNEVKMLFNNQERRQMILNSVSFTPDGHIKKEPTLRNLDRNYEFMPRYGKQVGPRSVVIPCLNRNYISFAKLDF